MAKGIVLLVKESSITVIRQNETDYISLTDMTAGFNEGSGLIGKWITNKNTLEALMHTKTFGNYQRTSKFCLCQ